MSEEGLIGKHFLPQISRPESMLTDGRITSFETYFGDRCHSSCSSTIRTPETRLSTKWSTPLPMSDYTCVYRYSDDYFEKKERIMKGKFKNYLKAYFKEGYRKTPENSDREESSDENYDTDLDSQIGRDLIVDEAVKKLTEYGEHPEYKRYCDQLGVVPNSYLIRHSLDETLKLKYRYPNPRDTRGLAFEMQNNGAVEKLNMAENGINANGLLGLSNMLITTKYISELNLSDNRLGASGAEIMKMILLDNSHLLTVDISGNNIREKGAKHLAEIIENNVYLRYLGLSRNAISDGGAAMIGKALVSNVTLETLDLSWNSIGTEGAKKLAKGLKANGQLKVLNLNMNGLKSRGALAITSILRHNDSLQELDLSENRIVDNGINIIVNNVLCSKSLKTFKLNFNLLTKKGLADVVRLVNGARPSCKLDRLEIKGIITNGDFRSTLEKAQNTPNKKYIQIIYSNPPSGRARGVPLVHALDKVVTFVQENDIDRRQLCNGFGGDDTMLTLDDVFQKIELIADDLNLGAFDKLKSKLKHQKKRQFQLRELKLIFQRKREGKEMPSKLPLTSAIAQPIRDEVLSNRRSILPADVYEREK